MWRRSGADKAPAPYATPAPRCRKAGLEKKPEAKKRPSHLRAVPSPMSLPFFDAPDSTHLGARCATPMRDWPAQERVKLKALLGELEGLKKKPETGARRKAHLIAPARLPRARPPDIFRAPEVFRPQILVSERGAAWLAHQSGGLGVVGSNPAAPTNFSFLHYWLFGSSSRFPYRLDQSISRWLCINQ